MMPGALVSIALVKVGFIDLPYEHVAVYGLGSALRHRARTVRRRIGGSKRGSRHHEVDNKRHRGSEHTV